MSGNKQWNVLFLCRGNSARSIIAESLLRRWGGERFVAYSAGSHPAGRIHPLAGQLLEHAGLPVDGLRSKSLDEFTGPDAPRIDFVITVCDDAAEQCPLFPGQPITAHWGMPDPARVDGDEETRMQAFRRTRSDLERRIKLFVDLPFSSLDRLSSQGRVRALGDSPADATSD